MPCSKDAGCPGSRRDQQRRLSDAAWVRLLKKRAGGSWAKVAFRCFIPDTQMSSAVRQAPTPRLVWAPSRGCRRWDYLMCGVGQALRQAFQPIYGEPSDRMMTALAMPKNSSVSSAKTQVQVVPMPDAR